MTTVQDVRAAADRLRTVADAAAAALRARQDVDGWTDEEMERRVAAVRAYVATTPVEWYPTAVANERLHTLTQYLERNPVRDIAGVLGDPPQTGLEAPWSLTCLRQRPDADTLARLRVVTLLDVDGVVLRQPATPGVKHPQIEDEDGRVWDLDVFDRLGELDVAIEDGSRTGAELAWLTSWASTPRDLDALLGRLPDQILSGGWVLAGRVGQPDPRWKLAAVKELEEQLPAHVALVWIDDHLRTIQRLDPVWAAGTTRDRLLLSPHPSTGLLPGDLRRLGAFMDARRA